MARNVSTGGDDLFENMLRKEKSAVEHRAPASSSDATSEQRLANLLSSNQTLPVTISSVQVHGAKNTRKDFLDPILEPIITGSRDADFTMAAMLEQVGEAVQKLQKFDIFHPNIMVHLSQPSQVDPSTSPTDLEVSLAVREKSRFLLKTGTDLGNTEGSAYGSLLWRNIFGGAETLTLNAAAGTRTRSAYSAELAAPVRSNPNLRISLEGLASATQKPWASHEEVLKGAGIKLNWLSPAGDQHQVGFAGSWRQLTGLSANASPGVRADAGDSVKNALSYIYTRDRRGSAMLPQNGYLFKTVSELAGWGPLGGDVAFSKSEVELGGAVPVPIPGVKGFSGVSIGGGFKAGMLYPLPLSYGLNGALPSRINDRFTLGGPTDVRGFSLGGLGPRDGSDALGGDVYAAGSVNMLVPLPRIGADSPFRIQLFANGGRSVALKNRSKSSKDSSASSQTMSGSAVSKGITGAAQEILTGLPTLAAGVGLVYAHPVARFELNFSLPLVVRRGEEARKGLQVGVGINFL